MTIAEASKEAALKLRNAGFELPGYEARELICGCLELDSTYIITGEERELTHEQHTKFHSWLEQRVNGMPLAYLTKKKGFFKHEFAVEPGVLIPRPETELVVDVALKRCSEKKIKKLADLGAGSGCIGLSLLHEFNGAKLWAVESSPKAAAIILKNAESLGIYEHVKIDCIKVERWDPETKLDLIVANPPYIPQGDPKVQKSVHEFEPHAALYSGPDGLDALRIWIARAYELLKQDGAGVFEIGAGQSGAVRAIMEDAGFRDVQIDCDLAGIERVVSGLK